jgi:hypothetical protein
LACRVTESLLLPVLERRHQVDRAAGQRDLHHYVIVA